MKRGLAIFAFLLVVTIEGGVVTAGFNFQVPVIHQTSDPSASVFEATPEQANMLVILIGFVLFNVLGAGATLAFLFWFGNREVLNAAKASSNTPAAPAQELLDALDVFHSFHLLRGSSPNQTTNQTTVPSFLGTHDEIILKSRHETRKSDMGSFRRDGYRVTVLDIELLWIPDFIPDKRYG